MNYEEPQVATEEHIKKFAEYMERPEVKAMWKQADEEHERVRKIYVDNPNRKTKFDIVEILWFESLERYGRTLSDEQMTDVIDKLVDDYRWHEVVYDVVQQYGGEQGWKERH